ncbi:MULTISPECIES: GntR family transcriptional regulator [unclassified Paenibacillus]|uniref:GntR family transcriptional regulator n=1 Tax=unclassified Paenibacillus TaxID=185978 RepID=UPI0009A585C1|nr:MULTISPECIES: GntR family transcriptional regulator [unclassified Paenibacillus]SLK19083.1 DNA-binding transcriptional regulator, LacI/PurR family [Paenibacillus sp. RU5A]SOC75607.1 DNA-binding transcriptional regulator, LacI/PurR family [Paenibacillus sp. RU26A]SOC77559.1 DNA-binding transcriptional regulator, LacI/PurR family [Paenibacillus sp. RU5M]
MEEPHRKPLLYLQTADLVMEEIRNRKLQPHDPVPSEGELAKLYSVSRMTAKLALQILEKQGIVYRLARRGTFVSGDYLGGPGKEFLSGNVTTDKKLIKRKIALLFPNMDDYVARIIASVEQEARKSGCQLLIRITTDKEDESFCLQELYEEGIDGIILFPRGRTRCSEKVLELNLLNYPLVIIDRIFREVNIDCVYHDHYQGAYNLTEYLIDRGHREIGYISMSFDGVTSREDRYKGYVQAMLDYALPVNGRNICLDCAEDYMLNLNGPNLQLKDFIQSNPAMTAVVCADDYIATSGLYTALSIHKQVPEELSIIGFSDIQLASLLPVPLTTARQTTEKLGQAAVNLLCKRMENSREGALSIKVNTTIIERSSVRNLNQ